MEMDPQERDSEVGDDSPISHNDEDMTDGERDSPRDPEDADSCEELRRHTGLLSGHGDILEKLKLQVQDMKEEFVNSRHLSSFSPVNRLSATDGFQLPMAFPFSHPATAFLPPLAPQPQQPHSSGSSHSSEGSASSPHTWSFEEQFKQLYEISDDPGRKEFLDDLFSFMQKRGTPINRLPIMAKSVLDLYELFNLVVARGGLVDVINKKLWQEIIKGLHLPSSITSAAFTLRTQYMKYLYPYECERKGLSTSPELQAAIDGNRREGRRASTNYPQYEGLQRSPNPNQINQLSHLSLINPHQELARMSAGPIRNGVGVHHPSHPHPMGQPLNGGPLPALPPNNDFEARMMEYMKMLNKEIRGSTSTTTRRDETSPPTAASPLNPLELQRLNLWSMYQQAALEPQKEALNLSDPAPPLAVSVKREQPRDSSPPCKKVPRDEHDAPGPSPTLPNTHIKIKGADSRNGGEKSVTISMELNGVTYSGVLYPQSTSNGRTTLTS